MQKFMVVGESDELEIVNEFLPEILFTLDKMHKLDLPQSTMIQNLQKNLKRKKIQQDIISIVLKAVRAADGKMIQYFLQTDEFQCMCCGAALFDKTFLSTLKAARAISQIEYPIYDGFHCIEYYRLLHASLNAEDDYPGSCSHTKGLGVNIWAEENENRYKIVHGLIKAGFSRIGLAPNFVHADLDRGPNTPENVIWLDGERITDSCHQRFTILKALIRDVGVKNLEIGSQHIGMLTNTGLNEGISLAN